MDKHKFIDFQGKYVVVTGATSGIGEAVAAELLCQGAKPILVGRDPERLKNIAARLDVPKECQLKLDLNNHDKILPAIKELSQKVGRLYGLCHSAGIVDTSPLRSSTADKIKAMLDVNLVAGLELTRAVCSRDIMEEDGGSVLFISSIYGLIGMPGEVGYSASKGALASAARTMAIELARRNIRVNVLSPGLVKTPMTDKAFARLLTKRREDIENAHPLGPGTPDDVAKASVFLLAPQSRWITGTNLVIDGGYTAK